MDSNATLRFHGISALKMRQVADMVRGKDVDVALHTLRFITKVGARTMEKLITSAVANAREKANAADARFDADTYYVKTVMVDEGPSMKRFRPRAQGRAYRIRKRSCHVNLTLAERAGHTVEAPAKPAAKVKASGEGSGSTKKTAAKRAPARAAAAKKSTGAKKKAASKAPAKREKKSKTAAR
jgi:large subunit ribosomal protein L22